MIELFGLELGTAFQGGTMAVAVASLFTALGIWFRYGPDRKRASNEEKVIDNAETDRQFRAWRDEIHGYRNQVQVLLAAQLVNNDKQTELEKLLTHALATSSVRKDQMINMMSLIELLIAEIERIAPKSIIVPQARLLLKQMRDSNDRKVDPLKSDALNIAETAVQDAKQTLISTKETCEEVKRSEEGK